jgi:hypothetical protein
MSESVNQTWIGVFVETQDIAGEAVWSVTTSRLGYDTRRRLFTERGSACAYGLEQAEWHDLPFFDLAEVPAE